MKSNYDSFWPKFGAFNFMIAVILMVGALIFVLITHFIHVDEDKVFKCFKYVDYEYKEFVLFEDLKNLRRFDKNNSDPCNYELKFSSKVNDYLVFSDPIEVILVDDTIDSLFCKIKYRNFLIKKDYYTYKCFVQRYSPEDFTF